MNLRHVLVSELIGTFVLVLAGPGVMVLASPTLRDNTHLAVALAVGLAAALMVSTIGRESGGHMNPVVTIGMALLGKIELRAIPSFLIGQLVGAVLAALSIWTIAHNASDSSPLGRTWDGAGDTNFATNMWTGEFMGFVPMAAAEILLSALLVFAYGSLANAERSITSVIAGPIGAAWALVYVIGQPVDNASANPFRSVAMALFSGGSSLEQLWAFVVFPVIGAALGAGLAYWLRPSAPPVALPATRASRASSVRESAARAAASVRDTIED